MSSVDTGLTELEAAISAEIDVELIDSLTCALIEAPSENPGGTEAATVEVLAGACRTLGLPVGIREVAPGRPNLSTTLASSAAGPGLMFLGHSDVVPAGPNWTGDPFRARHDVDAAGRAVIIGRGATDMKGGLAAVIAAMAALGTASRHGAELTGPVQLVVTVDEEEHGAGVRDFVTEANEHRFAGCVVAEPTDLEIVRGCRGASYIEIEIRGRAAHSGRPADGRSAITAGAAIVGLIGDDQSRLAQTVDDLLGHGTWNVGTIAGGQGISVVAPTCSLGVDRRLMPDESAEAIAARLRTEISDAGIDTDGIDVDVTVTMEMPGFATEPTHPIVTAAAGAVRTTGRSASVGGWTAACDGGFVSRDLGISPIVLGPGSINTQAHQPDESVVIADLVDAAHIYVLMALRLLS